MYWCGWSDGVMEWAVAEAHGAAKPQAKRFERTDGTDNTDDEMQNAECKMQNSRSVKSVKSVVKSPLNCAMLTERLAEAGRAAADRFVLVFLCLTIPT